jgi:hypothetical protein
MDNDVKSHQFPKIFVSDTQHVGIVSSIIEIWVHVWDGTFSIAVVENKSCNS